MVDAIKYDFPLLSDPKKDRVVSEVTPPPHKPLTKSALFPPGNIPSSSINREACKFEPSARALYSWRNIELGRLLYNSEASNGSPQEGS